MYCSMMFKFISIYCSYWTNSKQFNKFSIILVILLLKFGNNLYNQPFYQALTHLLNNFLVVF